MLRSKSVSLIMFRGPLLCFFALILNIKGAVIKSDIQKLSDKNDPVTLCYYTDWSPHRTGKAHFEPKDIDHELCTHIIYVFSTLNETTMDQIEPEEPELDIGLDYYGQVTALQKYGKKVLIGMGGWVDSTPKYGTMLRTDELRKKLVLHITERIIKYNFDGIEVDILFPGAYQGNVTSGSEQDKQYFLSFLRELRDSFDYKANQLKRDRLLLTVAAGVYEPIVDIAYQVPGIVALCDWVSLLTYNFHGPYENRTGLVSPFMSQPNDDKFEETEKENVQGAIGIWLDRGATPNKLVIGFSSFGRTFSLVDPNVNEINSPTQGEPAEAEYTHYIGYIGYYEVIERIQKGGWTVIHKDNLGSYAFKDKQWMSFDDKVDVAVKAEYVKNNGFLGASIWSLELECFQEDCPVGRYPLLSTMRGVLTGSIRVHDVKNGV